VIEVTVESIRVSLISQQRLVVLRETGTSRFLPIFIGPCEAEAITLGLQGTEVARPMTHDLLKGVIEQLGGKVEHIVISELRNDTFYATVVVDQQGNKVEVDARPSDAIALGVRLDVTIYVNDSVMEQAGQLPSEQLEDESESGERTPGDDTKLSVFRDFIETLDLDDLTDEDND
jgi:bifunctional DNase/RNase